MATKARQQYHADEVTLSKERREFSISDDVQEKIDGIEEGAQVNTIETIRVNGNEVQPDENKAIDLTIPGVIDSLSSTSITDALSARQGKILYDKIDNVSRIGHFLALWDASTGLPVTDPETSPYEYHAGDFYIISVVASQGGTNYKPSGTEYISGQASTDVEVDDVEVNDFYFYDGQVWRHMKNSGAGDVVIDGSLSTTSRNPVENRVITNALSGKQNTLTAGANIQISGNTISATDTKYTAGTGISIVNGVISNTQTSAEWGNITGTLSDQTDLQTVLTSKATDADVVHKTGAETIGGTKTFSTSPVVPSKTTAATNTGTAIATEAQVYKKQDTLVSGTNIKTINGTSLLGSGNITLNDVKSSSTAPSSPTEGMVWYDTTNDELKVYDGTNWNVVGDDAVDINTKTFYLSGTSDLTNAQAAYDWYIAGKNPIIQYNKKIYTLSSANSSLLGFNSTYPEIEDFSSGYSIGKSQALNLTISSGTVTAIGTLSYKVSTPKTLATDVNYSTPYTPQYDGSPATKKYVDDNINTKTFYLSNTSDLTNAQAAVDWFLSGKNPIIYYSGATYNYAGQIIFEDDKNGYRFVASAGVVGGSPSGQGVTPSSVENFVISLKVDSNNTVTNIYSETLDVDVLPAYSSSEVVYTPINSWDPATKEYVDDNSIQKSSIAPSSPVEGMVWYDTTNDKLKVYDGTNWNEVGKEYIAGEGIKIGTAQDYSAMQGPAPTGYHIPSRDEWVALRGILISTLGFAPNATTVGTYLKMPTAGNRNFSSSSANNQGDYGYYWSSTASSTVIAYSLYFNSYTLSSNGYNRAFGFSIRCFKDSPVVPTSSWTTLYDGSSIATGAGIFRNSSLGLISVSGDGTTWYTIQDKNLGATTVYNQGDTLTDANCGGYFQWGNNYMFPGPYSLETITTSSTQVDASGYGPGNYYSSSTFITRGESPYDWSSVQNDNLRGGVTGVVTLDNTITNTGVLSVNGEAGAVTVEEGDSKVFVISDLTSAASLATATQAYTYAYTTGKSAIIRYSNTNYVYAYGTTTSAFFTRAYGNGNVGSGAWASIASIKATVSSGSVTAMTLNNNLIDISSSAPSFGTTNRIITLVI